RERGRNKDRRSNEDRETPGSLTEAKKKQNVSETAEIRSNVASSIDIWVSKCQYDVSDVTPMWDQKFDVDGRQAGRSGAKRSEVREYILRSRNHSATVATKLQTISSSHRSSRKSLVGRTSMNQRGLLSIGRIWSSLDLLRSADREYDGRETGRTLFVSFRSGGEDMEWKGMRNKIKREKETGRE
ncbi:hypothetical protein ALC57_16326, partial [Trachymyrmex cornetzi]